MARRAAAREEEARHLVALFQGDGARIMGFIQSQLMILASRAQMLLQLAGITITVTGFSGANIARTGHAAAALLVSGLVVVLLAASIAMVGILRLQWTTQIAPAPLEEAVAHALGVRDAKSAAYGAALVLLVLGLALYVSSVGLLLLGNLPPPGVR